MTLAQSADEGKRRVDRMLALHTRLAAATILAGKALVQARHQQYGDDIVLSRAVDRSE